MCKLPEPKNISIKTSSVFLIDCYFFCVSHALNICTATLKLSNKLERRDYWCTNGDRLRRYGWCSSRNSIPPMFKYISPSLPRYTQSWCDYSATSIRHSDSTLQSFKVKRVDPLHIMKPENEFTDSDQSALLD